MAALRFDRKLRMTKSKKPIYCSTRVRLSILLSSLFLLGIAGVGRAQAEPDLSGLWKQDNDRCQPKCSGDVTLHIEHRDPELTIETTIAHASLSPGHAVQKYATDGRVSISMGTDGDELHTSIIWKDSSLVFSIEEHEDGRILRSTETWSLIENGTTLKRIRERPNGEEQILFFRRIDPSPRPVANPNL